MTKRIYRSREKKIAGVCGGIAEYMDIDPTIVRLIWLIFGLVYGTGFLAYLICWAVIPSTP
ncbi:MAG: PspC domain-containing protein [Limnochordia bacterium]|jgi:phage shock protein C|nr:PspC domain-containing protein [Limnochordia bacterium]